MTKCDFCTKPMVGYLSQQCAMYCEDHEKEAEAVEAKMYEEMEKYSYEQHQ